MSKQYFPLAMAVAGHHSGLLDGGLDRMAQAQDGTFFGRLKGDFAVTPRAGVWIEIVSILCYNTPQPSHFPLGSVD